MILNFDDCMYNYLFIHISIYSFYVFFSLIN